MLSFSANTENPAELEISLQRLLELRSKVIFGEDEDLYTAVPLLENGEAVVALAWAYDALLGREANPHIQYILPEEGCVLWGDNFVIPANSPHQKNGELFLNFLLQPQVSAQVANYNKFATPNEGALSFIDPVLLDDPVIFPTEEDLLSAEIILPLSSAGEKLYMGIWDRFMSAVSGGGLDER